MTHPEDQQWATWVERGQSLLRQESETNWGWGDLALEVAPIGPSGTNTATWARLEKFAEEIGVKAETLKTYREIADRWPPPTRIEGVSWSVHRVLRANPERVRVLSDLVEAHGSVTVKMAKVAVASVEPIQQQLAQLCSAWDEVNEAGVYVGSDEGVEIVMAVRGLIGSVKVALRRSRVLAEELIDDDPFGLDLEVAS